MSSNSAQITINQPLADILSKLMVIGKHSEASLTIGNVYHLIKYSDESAQCKCNYCSLTNIVSISEIERHCIMECIISCDNFEISDPIEFIIWELQSGHLNKVNTFNQFLRRKEIISNRVNHKISTDTQSSIPPVLQTDIIIHTIFDYVGGDYFVTFWKNDS